MQHPHPDVTVLPCNTTVPVPEHAPLETVKPCTSQHEEHEFPLLITAFVI